MKKKILLSTLLLCAGMSSAWADAPKTTLSSTDSTTLTLTGADGYDSSKGYFDSRKK